MKKKILVVLLILVFLYCIGGVIYSILVRQTEDEKRSTVEKNNIVEIKGYNYTMDEDKETSLFKTNFLELKKVLESETIDYNAYADLVAKLYIIDFYTLKNKINKYDIGGVQFIYPEAQDNFKLKASDSIYKYLLDNTEGNRKQELPLVSEIFTSDLNESTYKIGEEDLHSYEIKVDWLYEKDLGYDVSAKLILVKKGEYISVVEESRVEENE